MYVSVPAATGGDTPLTYSATGLPSGVSMSADRQVSSTPTAAGSGTATVTVTDDDGDTDTAQFAWTVEADTDTLSFDWTVEDGDPIPEFPANPVNPMGPYAWIQGTAITAFTVDAATGGDAPLSYSATALPDGVTMSAGRVVSGTPTATGSGTATITVTDNDGDTDTLSFVWSVSSDPTCVYPENPVGPYTWIQGRAITAFSVPASSCGTPPFTYSATGLPDGLSMSAERVVAGTPATTGSGTATVTVTDSNSDTDTLTFEWTVEAEPEERGTIDNPHILPNPLQVSALDVFSLIRGTGGGNNAASATYFRFTVPEGRAGEWTVAMDGSPNSRADWDLRGDSGLRATSYNADESDEVTLTAGQTFNFRIYPYITSARSRLTGLTLTLSPPASANPVFPVDPLPARTWIAGIAITAFTVDEATGGVAPLTYSATGLPAGVDMNVTTRTVSGTPTAAGSGTATITATATDTNNATGTVTLAWTVEADTEPMFAVDMLPARTWTQDSAITVFTVEAATGGNAPLSYSDSGLPAGITMSATREIAGTPTVTGSGTATITVTDRDGDTGTVTFEWNIPTCQYPAQPLGPYTWFQGTAITAFSVPEPSCGTAPFNYSATGLPAGLMISSAGEVSGTPTATGSGMATVTVTDDNGDTDTLTFEWTVQAEPGSINNPHVQPNPLQVSALDVFSLIRGTGRGNNAAASTYFRFTVPAGRAGEWTVAIDGTPNSVADWNLQGDGGLRGTSSNANESDEVMLTAGQIYNFWVYPFNTSSRSRLTGLTLTLTPPDVQTCEFPDDPLGPYTWIQDIAITAFTVPAASCDDASLSYSATGLPAGITMSSAREVSGMPTSPGMGTATVTVTDSNDATDTLTFAWTVVSSNRLTMGFDEHYTAHTGLLNDDSRTDIYLKHTPDLVFVPVNDELVPVFPEHADVGDFVLVQNSDGTFDVQSLTPSQKTLVSRWPAASGIRLTLGDFNLDNVYDVYISGVSGALTGTLDQNVLDQVIFASSQVGQIPIQSTAMTQLLETFFSEAYEWSLDHDYFDNNAPILVSAKVVNTTVFMAEYCGVPGTEATMQSSPPVPPIVASSLEAILAQNEVQVQTCRARGFTSIHRDFVRVTYTISIGNKDYTVFSSMALAFASIMSTVETIGGLIAESSEAMLMEQLFKAVWNLQEFMGDVLSQGGSLGGESEISTERRAEVRKIMIDGLILHTDFLTALVDARESEAERARERVCVPRAWGRSPISMEKHYGRNAENQSDPTPWQSLSDLPQHLFNNWGETPTHNLRTSGNQDWRGKYSSDDYRGWQLIYDASGTLVTDDKNLGSYDFGPPPLEFGTHVWEDITPWLEWGNVSTRESTRVERLAALYRSKLFSLSMQPYFVNLYSCLYPSENLD